MLKMFKLIVTDLDGTLLRGDKTISDYTVNVLKEAKQNGIIVAFATARGENACKRFTSLVKPDALISSGGALVKYGQEEVARITMAQDVSNELLKTLIEYKGVGRISADTESGHFVNRPVDESDPGWADYLPAQYVDFKKGISFDSYKIQAEIFEDGLEKKIADKFPSVDVIGFAGEKWVRFADKAANKLEGIKSLAAHLNIDMKDVVAFGDDYNDIEMLGSCGTGIAVANAIDEVKAAADEICDTNDNDGVAKWLEENILSKE